MLFEIGMRTTATKFIVRKGNVILGNRFTKKSETRNIAPTSFGCVFSHVIKVDKRMNVVGCSSSLIMDSNFWQTHTASSIYSAMRIVVLLTRVRESIGVYLVWILCDIIDDHIHLFQMLEQVRAILVLERSPSLNRWFSSSRSNPTWTISWTKGARLYFSGLATVPETFHPCSFGCSS